MVLKPGNRKPELIAPYYADFLELQVNRNNRLVWGGMIALTTIASISLMHIGEHSREGYWNIMSL